MLECLYALPSQLPGCRAIELQPLSMVEEITKLNDLLYSTVNNGAYRSVVVLPQNMYVWV